MGTNIINVGCNFGTEGMGRRRFPEMEGIRGGHRPEGAGCGDFPPPPPPMDGQRGGMGMPPIFEGQHCACNRNTTAENLYAISDLAGTVLTGGASKLIPYLG